MSGITTSSGLSGVATAASVGAKRQKEDKNVSGQNTIAIKEGDRLPTKETKKEKEHKNQDKQAG